MLPLSLPPSITVPAPDAADQVRAAFDRFVEVQNAHDLKALAPLLSASPAFLWITRGAEVWGRDAALARFAALYQGTWRLEPESGALRIVVDRPGVVQLFVPIRFTMGPAGEPPQQTRILMNQTWAQEDGAWKLVALLPIPAAAAAGAK